MRGVHTPFCDASRGSIAWVSRYGGLRKTVIDPALRCMRGTTVRGAIEMAESGTNSLGRVNPLCCELPTLQLCLYGESSSMIPVSTESTALPSATKVRTKAVSLSDRLTPSLISAGLVRGTTPRSVRRMLGAIIPDIVSSWQGGLDADIEPRDR